MKNSNWNPLLIIFLSLMSRSHKVEVLGFNFCFFWSRLQSEIAQLLSIQDRYCHEIYRHSWKQIKILYYVKCQQWIRYLYSPGSVKIPTKFGFASKPSRATMSPTLKYENWQFWDSDILKVTYFERTSMSSN